MKNTLRRETSCKQLGRVLMGSAAFGWLSWLDFFVFYWEKPFSVGLVDQLFQSALSLVEMVENDE